LGRALLGKKAGDTAVVKRPAGEVEYEVLKVRWV
jgi:transcription elongation GreA/GreB family factor